jgi:hypothetical protein
MLSQTSAFLTRSIRQESRLLSHHLVRCGMVLLMMYLLLAQVIGAQQRAASGLDLMSSVMRCCYWCLTLLGVMYFSVAITEEKEEETLPLLRMTGVRNATLLLGKSLPRLAVVVLLVLVASPFLMLAVTLGGVVSEQIFASLLGLMCYAFCLSQMGLFASTVSRNSARAVSSTFLLWLLLEFGTWLFYLGAIACDEWGWSFLAGRLRQISSDLWERTMWQACETYLLFERGEAIWHPQMTFHLFVGSAFFGLSLWLFERFNQHSIAQGAVATVATARGISTRTSSLKSLRCWDAALEWKSWQFHAGGLFWFWIWLFSLPLLSIFVIVVIGALVGDFPPGEVYGISLMLVGTAALVILLARLFGSFLNQEIQQQTLVSLCMLPRGRGEILRRLSVGLMPFMIAPVVCFSLGFMWMMLAEPYFLEHAFEWIREPWFWAILGWAVVTVHFGTLISVYFRHGGMLIAIACCWFILPFMMGAFFSILAVLFGFMFRGPGGDFAEHFFRYLVPMIAIVAEAAVCFVSQRLVLRRIEELAAR